MRGGRCGGVVEVGSGYCCCVVKRVTFHTRGSNLFRICLIKKVNVGMHADCPSEQMKKIIVIIFI